MGFLPWYLRQSVLFSPCLLNFGSHTKGVCTKWDNLKWRCLRNDSCDYCPGLCPAAGTQTAPCAYSTLCLCREQAAQREIPTLVQDLQGRGRVVGVDRGLSEPTQKPSFDGWSVSGSSRSPIGCLFINHRRTGQTKNAVMISICPAPLWSLCTTERNQWKRRTGKQSGGEQKQRELRRAEKRRKISAPCLHLAKQWKKGWSGSVSVSVFLTQSCYCVLDSWFWHHPSPCISFG